MTKQQKGIGALILMTFLGSLMGVWVRSLGEHFKLYQQVTVRAFSGFLIGFLIYGSKIRFQEFKSLSRKDLIFILLRSISAIIGIGLYSLAVMTTKFANVSFIFSLPTTAFLGVIFLKEKLNSRKLALLFIGFLGTLLITMKLDDISNLTFGRGEMLAFIATFFYSFSYITRKWFSPKLNNFEITESVSFFCIIFAFLVSQIAGDGIREFTTLSLHNLITIILAGLTFISIGYFSSYGFERVEAIIANNILILESVFSLLIGFFVYRETLTLKETIGGLIIILSAYGMNRIKKR